MYKEFGLSSITTNLKEKTIDIKMTFDVDIRSIVGDCIQLLDRNTSTFVLYMLDVKEEHIILTLPKYPVPNSRYALVISDICDVLGNKLAKGINYDISFVSTIKTDVKVISPIYSEEITDSLIVALNEYIRDDLSEENITFTNSFYIEVSTDNLFNNIIFTADIIDTNHYRVMDLPNGQYYLRARVQNDKEYGDWSEIITFVLNLQDRVDDEEEEIYIPQLSVVGFPKDGDDIQSFFIELSDDIDPVAINNIKVYRRLV